MHRHRWERVGYRKNDDLTRLFLLVDAYGVEELACPCGARGERLDCGKVRWWWRVGSGHYGVRRV